jgi:hypothetical protein
MNKIQIALVAVLAGFVACGTTTGVVHGTRQC